MVKFDGLVIVIEPDYKDRIEKGIEFDDLDCKVYDENDTEFKHCLLSFNMMFGHEYYDETIEDIEKGAIRVVETEWATVQVEKANLALERSKELLGNAIEYIKESVNTEDLNHVLKICIGMTDEEINSLNEKHIEEQNDGMNLS